MKPKLKAVLVTALVLLMLAPAMSRHAYAEAWEANITIDTEGVVHVYMEMTARPGINEYALPVDPILASLVTRLNGSLIASFYVNGTLFVPAETPGTVTVEYIANVTVGKSGSSFTVRPGFTVTLTVMPNVILLSMPEGLVSSRVEDGNLVLVIEGPSTINYTISTVSTTTAAPPPGAEQTTTTTLTETTEAKGKPPTLLLAAVLAIVGGLAAAYYLMKRRGTSSSTMGLEEYLNSTDYMILRYLEKVGGTALQSVVQKELNLPKATLSRHVNKLARLGFIEVVREGKINRLILKKKPPEK